MAQYGQQHHFANDKDNMHNYGRMSAGVYGAPHPQGSVRPTSEVTSHNGLTEANHILTNNDSHLMNNFFNDPNNFSVDLNNLNAEHHPDANRDFADVFGYPSAGSDGRRPANGTRSASFARPGRQNEGDDMSAASQLVNMAHASPAHTHAPHPPPWSHLNNTGGVHPMISQSPMNDPTNRQSSSFYASDMQAFNDFASQQQIQARNNVQSARSAGLVEPRHEPFRQQQQQQQQQQLQPQQHHHHQQQQQQQHHHPSSLQLPIPPPSSRPTEPSPVHRPIEPGEAVAFFNAIPRQTQGSGSQPGRAPVTFSFGSDNSFSMTGYRAPLNEMEPRDKDGNLLGMVPSARLSRDPHELGGRPTERTHLNHMSFPVSHSANSSPGGYNGVSYAGPDGNNSTKMQPPSSVLKRRNTDVEFSHVSSFTDPLSGVHSRKRHHSVAQGSGMNHMIDGANMSHISCLPAIVDDGADNSGQYGRPVSKRSKTTDIQGPGTPISQNSDPAEAPSPGQTSQAKKKNRDTKSRPNLTESQKRENHIISEQKRRNVIKQAFTDLNSLIPTLQGGKSGLSKAEVLKEVVTYLNSLVEGNKRMDAFLNSLNGSINGSGNGRTDQARQTF